MTDATPIRAVLSATHVAQMHLSSPHDMRSCLMPCGTQTLIERLLDQLAHLGCKQVDLIVSDRPEALSHLNGDQWGLNLTWHWVKGAEQTYSILSSLLWQDTGKVLFGRAEQWLSDTALSELVASGNRILVRPDQPGTWTGWACCDAPSVQLLPPVGSTAELGDALRRVTRASRKIVDTHDWAAPASASDMLELQQRALDDNSLDSAAPVWIRKPWGLQSPQAWVDPRANITGPVIVGPGCFVSARTHLGPHAVLTKDVIVESEVSVSHVLALPSVHFGSATVLEHVIVGGRQVLHTRAQTCSLLPQLHSAHPFPTRTVLPKHLLSKSIALGVLVALSPLMATDWLVRKALGKPARWATQPAVTGHLSPQSGLRIQLLNQPTPQTSQVGRLLSSCGLLLDILRGSRLWFGARARSLGQWQSLPKDWQGILAATPVGMFHAPAWHELDKAASMESEAAADVFFAVNNGWKTRFRLLSDLLTRRIPTPSHPSSAGLA